MSNMASEMAARIADDGGAGLNQPAGGSPGSEGSQTPPAAPPAAEPSTTETGAGGGPPDTIPYARFKEVNDRLANLRGYEELAQLGLDPDSLGRLANFEAHWLQDPVGVWTRLADDLDLPQEVKDAVAKVSAKAGEPAPGQAQGQPSGGEQQPQYAQLSPEDKARLDRLERWEAQQQETDRSARLDGLVRMWTARDEKDQIETPEQVKLMAIAAAAGSGVVFPTLESLVDSARSTIVNYRSNVLGDAVRRTGPGGAPPALPGTSPASTDPMNFHGDIKAATRAAEAAIKAGHLPQATLGG